MRKFATLIRNDEEAAIICRDENDPPDEWCVFERGMLLGNAKMIVAALNESERSEARRTI